MINRFLALILLFVGVPFESAAQDSKSPTEAAKEGTSLVPDAVMLRSDPSLASASRWTELAAFIEASQDKTNAAIETGFRAKDDSRLFSIKVAGAIDEDNSETTLIDLDGLVGKTNLTLGLHWRRSIEGLLSRVARDELSVDAVVTCVLAHATVETMRRNEATLVTPKIEDLMSNSCTEIDSAIESALASDATGATMEDLDRDIMRLKLTDLRPEWIDPDLYSVVIKKLGLNVPLWTLDLELTYSPQETFEFVTEDSLETQSVKHDGFGVTLGSSWIPRNNKKNLFSLSYTYKESYKAGGKQQVCTPFGSVDDTLGCSEKVVGAPTDTTREIARIEFRRYFHRGKGSFWAITPRLSHDFKNDVTGIQFPFWAITDTKGNLTGGVSLGWDSENEDVAVTAFVGTLKNPFS